MTAADSAERAQQHYDPREVQEKWLAQWAGMDLFRASDDPADNRPRTYLLDMFPYPSGDLHMGHAEAYAIADAIARYLLPARVQRAAPDRLGRVRPARRERGHPQQHPPGRLDLREHRDRRRPRSAGTRCPSTGHGGCTTCDPEYYRWTQWLFLRFYERGLAYRKDGYVNWCPVDQTVLANEQVIDGQCERCGAEVDRRLLTQWYFKITEYADQLLADMAPLEGTGPTGCC